MAGTSNGSLATSKKLIISTIAIFVSGVFLGYCFEKTKPMASKIFVVHYPVEDASDATMYGYGPADGITLLYYVALTLMLTSCIEDIIQALKLSKNEDFSQEMTQILFYTSSLLFGIFVLTKGNYDWETFINGFPDHNVPFLMKVFLLSQLGFLLQCFPQALLQGLTPLESLASLIEAEVLVMFLGIAYAANYTSTAVAVLMSHYAANLLHQIAAISSDSRPFKLFMKFALFAAEHIVIVGAAFCICMYSDSRGQPLRWLALAVAVGWTALSGLAMFKDTGNTGKTSSSSNLPLLPTAPSSRKSRKRSRSRKGTGDRKTSRKRRR